MFVVKGKLAQVAVYPAIKVVGVDVVVVVTS